MAKKGRPTLLNKQLKEIAVRLASEKDMTLSKLASKLKIAESTLYLYLQKDRDFSEKIRDAMDMAEELVEISLFRRAIGYSHVEEKIFCHEGQIIRAKTMKHHPPSEAAAMWWLRNRRPDKWRDKPEADESDEKPIVISVDEQDL